MNESDEKYFDMNMSIKWPDEEPTVISYHSGYPDETLENVIHAFVTCLVGHTYAYKTIINGLKEYVEDHDDHQED